MGSLGRSVGAHPLPIHGVHAGRDANDPTPTLGKHVGNGCAGHVERTVGVNGHYLAPRVGWRCPRSGSGWGRPLTEGFIIPALLTRTWRPPSPAIVLPTASSALSGSETSQTRARTESSPPAELHGGGGLLEPVFVNVQHCDPGPSLAQRPASWRGPSRLALPAPVTIATLPAKRPVLHLLFSRPVFSGFHPSRVSAGPTLRGGGLRAP